MRRCRLLLLPVLLLAPAAPAAATCSDAVHVIGWGDSLTHGGDWFADLAANGFDWCQTTDHGKPGEESWNAAEAVNELSTRRFRDWLDGYGWAQPEDVIVLLWGTNDVRVGAWPDPRRAETRAALEQIADDALAAGFPVVVAVPPPIVATPEQPPGHSAEEAAGFDANLVLLEEDVQALVAARRAAGARIVAASAFAHFPGLPAWDGEALDYYTDQGVADGIHPGRDAIGGKQSGRYHLAELLGPAIVAAQATAVPASSAPARLVLAVFVLALGLVALRCCRAVP